MGAPIDTVELPGDLASGERGVCLRPFDEAGQFHVNVQGHEVRRLAVRGVSATTLAQGLGLAVQVGSILILARLLTPTDFGLVTMVTTFSLLFMNVSTNGFTEAVLQRQELDHFLTSNLFWINVAAAFILTVLFAAAGSLMARFYGNPRVTAIAAGMSLTIFLTSLSAMHLALLMKAMRFPTVYANQVFARFVSVGTSVLLAFAGWHYWALVGGAVMQPICEGTGAWILCRWIPARPRRLAATGSMVRFAVNVYGRFSFNYFSRNVDNLLVGWRFNAQSLGFYKKAYDLFALSTILQSFTPVALSALSRLNRDVEQYRRTVLKSLGVAAFLGMGVGGAVTLVGKDLIRVLLGPGWGPAGHIFTYFGPGFGVMFIYAIHSWIHLSLGRPGRWFKWGIVEFVVTGLMFVAALHWGPSGVAASWSLSLLVLTLPALMYAGSPVNLTFGSLISAVWKVVAAAFATVCVTALIVGRIGYAEPTTLAASILRMVMTSLVFCALYVSTVVLLHGSRAPLDQVVGLAREMVARRRSAAASVATREGLTTQGAEQP